MLYVSERFGWMMIVDAPNERAALAQAKRAASGASLLPSDITPAHIRPATDEDIEWHRAMSGPGT